MSKYTVEYYFAETQTEEVEAESTEAAEKQVMDDLAHQHYLLGRPTDMVFGIRDVQEVEEE